MLRAAPSPMSVPLKCGIPISTGSSGTMGNNGAVSALTAFPFTYPDLYLWMPAGAIAAASVAGYYYTQMSSATAGTVFNNVYTTGVPTIPASPTAFVTTGPGAFTGPTGALNGIQFSIPGNTIGPNGMIEYTALFTNNNSAGAKALTIAFGATALTTISNTTNVTEWVGPKQLWARGKTNGQVSPSLAAPSGVSTAANAIYSAIDTTAAVIVGFNFNNAVATDWAVCEAYRLAIFPG